MMEVFPPPPPRTGQKRIFPITPPGTGKNGPFAMPVSTKKTTTPWITQQVSDFCGVRVNHATECLGDQEPRLVMIIRAFRALDPDVNDENLARMVRRAMRTYGGLERNDPHGFDTYVRAVIRATGSD